MKGLAALPAELMLSAWRTYFTLAQNLEFLPFKSLEALVCCILWLFLRNFEGFGGLNEGCRKALNALLGSPKNLAAILYST